MMVRMIKVPRYTKKEVGTSDQGVRRLLPVAEVVRMVWILWVRKKPMAMMSNW